LGLLMTTTLKHETGFVQQNSRNTLMRKCRGKASSCLALVAPQTTPCD
jgi:hypothetical protein